MDLLYISEGHRHHGFTDMVSSTQLSFPVLYILLATFSLLWNHWYQSIISTYHHSTLPSMIIIITFVKTDFLTLLLFPVNPVTAVQAGPVRQSGVCTAGLLVAALSVDFLCYVLFPRPFGSFVSYSDNCCLDLLLLVFLRLCLFISYLNFWGFLFLSIPVIVFKIIIFFSGFWGLPFSSHISHGFAVVVVLIDLLILEWDLHKALCCPVHAVMISGSAHFALS